ncbi:unnamed protein product [Calypogeia fissa]
MGAIPVEQSRGSAEQQQQQQSPNPAAAISAAQFALWKQRKDAEAAAKAAEAARKRAEDITAGRVRMTGRELYAHEPWVFDDSRFE